jgi:phospho-N-acetylmuramoyl-pentapeptide-transferase
MLYHLLYPLHTEYAIFNVVRYLSFRSLAAVITALLVSFVLGPMVIRWLQAEQIGQPIRDDGPATHFKKAGTPTMGGSLIIIAVTVATLLWVELDNLYVWLVLLVLLSYGTVGFVDDYRKLRRKSAKGLRGKEKLFWQFVVAGIVAGALYALPDTQFRTTLTLPFLKTVQPDLGWFYIPFVMLVIVGTSNSVNLTDGLDGLAIGPVITCMVSIGVLTWVAGNERWSAYLQIPYVPGSGTLAIFCAAVFGAGLGFLWFNTFPAQVFMGDVGSLALGGALGTIAVIAKQELVLAVAGGIFVVETVSVILQVASFQWTGKRIFAMAPIHHHYELRGWAEPKIVVRFWIISVILAILALLTLKLR